jgi:cellulose synthase operon protein C
MPTPTRSLILPLLISLALLGGCKTNKQIADDYYQHGLALLAKGDEARAMVELRNVFRYDGHHQAARLTYAKLLLKDGNTDEAYSQLLRLIAQYPDDAEARRILAGIAISRGDWQEAEHQGRAALTLAPDDPQARAIGLALDYRKAVQASDRAARDRTAQQAEALLSAHPDLQLLRRIIVDDRISGPDPMSALPVVAAALTRQPKSLEFNQAKLRLLIKAGKAPAIGAQLKHMAKLFPDNADVRKSLVSWYMAGHDSAGAETFLREVAGSDTGPVDTHVALIQFLHAARGLPAAQAELDRLIAANAGTPRADFYGALKAGMAFDAGRQAQAIATLKAITDKAEPSAQTRRLQVMLARMLDKTGDTKAARALVEKVLGQDAKDVDALKLRAGWLIAEDKPGDAIVDLRTALDQSPHDAQTLTLLAQAYLRNGDTDLAGDQLAAAADVSGSAPAESLRYAKFLASQGRWDVAQSVLLAARRVSPRNLAVLAMLGSLDLRARDWSAAQQIADSLRKLGTPPARRAAEKLQAAVLTGQDRIDQSLSLLESEVGANPGNDAGAVAAVLRTMILSGRIDDARKYLDAALAKSPESQPLHLMQGSLDALTGDKAGAEAVWRGILAKSPGVVAPTRLLYGLLVSNGQPDAANAVLDAALQANPGSEKLRFLKAGALEQAGKYDGAIAIYEALYAEHNGDIVLANNLASMLTTYRVDAESLARAYAIARRLRGIKQPAFQDTYGWIQFRRGNLQDALASLEPAAAGLPKNAMAQYHLGMVYAALGRNENAIRQLSRALKIAGNSPLPQYDRARKTLARLRAGKSPAQPPSP